MSKGKNIKPYAQELITELRKDNVRTTAAHEPDRIDLAEVTKVRGTITIEPLNDNVEYTEDYCVWAIDPSTVDVGDLVVIGRDKQWSPIVLCKADGNNEDPLDDPNVAALRDSFLSLENDAKYYKPPVSTLADLPTDPTASTNGDIRLVLATNTLYRWDSGLSAWSSVSGGASGNFVDETGDTMTGDLVMSSGTVITLTDPPVDPTDAVNKSYVDSLIGTFSTTTITGNYTALSSDSVILVNNATLGAITIALPAVHTDGKVYYIKDIAGNAGTYNIVLNPVDSDTVDGQSTFSLTVNRQSVQVVSDGSNWWVI